VCRQAADLGVELIDLPLVVSRRRARFLIGFKERREAGEGDPFPVAQLIGMDAVLGRQLLSRTSLL
jgi:hypothetical protein